MNGRLSLRASVFALALLSILAVQAASFALLLAFPAQAPPPVVPSDVASAFRLPASAEATGLRLRESGPAAPFGQDAKSYAIIVSSALRTALSDAGVRDVRVRSLSDAVSMNTDGPVPPSITHGRGWTPGVTTDPMAAPFPSFTTALQRRDGSWVLVEPRASPAPPGYLRIAAAFALSALLLAPLAWWTSRRLTRPLQVLAEASRALGRNPGAAPLAISGPAEVRDAAAAFNAMQDSLARYMDERATLMAAIAHDLRTPLTSLRLRAEAAPGALRDRMAADIARMEALISDLLLFVQGARVSADRELLDLRELVRDVTGALLQGAVVVAGDTAQVFANESAIQRVVENLVGNAMTYGGGAEVMVVTTGTDALLEVADQGPGIPEANLSRVFEPFFRLEASRSRGTGGVGLGLAIARSIARAHGGEVELANRTGGGLSARLRLPLAADSKTII